MLTICLAEVVFEERFDVKGKEKALSFFLKSLVGCRLMVFVHFKFCLWFSFGRNTSLQIGVGVVKENIVSVTRMYGGFEGRHLLDVCPRFLLGHHRKLVARGCEIREH